MRVLLTGVTGYIGGCVAESLVRSGHEVYGIIRPTSDVFRVPRGVKGIMIAANKELYSALEIEPDVVIHIAGMFLGEHSEKNIEQMLESNVVFSTMLVDAVCKAGCRYFINTASYWQNYKQQTYNPVNLYAATKQAFEDVVKYYTEAKKIAAMSLIMFDVYGPGDSRRKVLNLVAELQDGEELKMSPGEQMLYMCYIEDVVMAYEQALGVIIQKPMGIYEKWAIRSETPNSLREIIDKYIVISKKNIKLQWGGLEYRKREIMDPSGIGEILPGWRPQYTLEAGLRKFCGEG